MVPLLYSSSSSSIPYSIQVSKGKIQSSIIPCRFLSVLFFSFFIHGLVSLSAWWYCYLMASSSVSSCFHCYSASKHWNSTTTTRFALSFSHYIPHQYCGVPLHRRCSSSRTWAKLEKFQSDSPQDNPEESSASSSSYVQQVEEEEEEDDRCRLYCQLYIEYLHACVYKSRNAYLSTFFWGVFLFFFLLFYVQGVYGRII